MASQMPPPHLRAWYCYQFAAEVFSACAIALFLPILLEKMAKEVGYLSPDYVTPCTANTETDSLEQVCRASILGIWMDTASFSMYVKSVAVALQAICIISIGPLADSHYWRKRLLVTFAIAGSLSGIAFLILPSTTSGIVPPLAALLTVIGGICYAIGVVCSNAFLPSLAKEDQSVLAALKSSQGTAEEIDEELDGELGEGVLDGSRILPARLEPVIEAISTSDLASQDQNGKDGMTSYEAILSLTMSRISSVGVAIGFFSGVTVLALLLIPVTIMEGTTGSLRLAVGLSGVWWCVFLIPAWIGLPGGDFKEDVSSGEPGISWLRRGWKRVLRMVSLNEMKSIPNLFLFLLAWIFLSDGFHTTTYVSILYASSSLHMSATKVALLGILVQLAAVISSILAPRLQRKLGFSNLKLLLYIVMLTGIVPAYGSLGLLLPFGGLRTEAEMYAAATWFGMLYGPFNSYSRAVYAELIPAGHESSFFSLFALTDKSASFLGPLVVGVIADVTGNIRLGFVFLLFLLLAPIPVLLKVNMDQGRRQAASWSAGKQEGERQELLLHQA